MLNGKMIFSILLVVLTSSMKSFANESEAVPGEYIVKLRPTMNIMGMSELNKKALSQSLGAYVKTSIPEFNLVVVKRATFETQTSSIKTLNQNPLVEYSEPNFIYHVSKAPNDPDLKKLWGLNNTAQAISDSLGIAGVDIAAEKAWDIETGSEKVLVAVIDTGIDYNHQDIKENIWTNFAELNGKPGVDDDGNGVIDDIHGANFVDAEKPTGNPIDDHGHGTHCSGTIGAKGDDGKGIVGVNWNVRILGAKFLSADGSGSLEGAVKAIAYANKMGAKVLSNSWGGGGFSQALKDVIEETNKSGAIFIAAAGNESNNNDKKPSYPASYQVENIISVAAIDNMGAIAKFSNYGKTSVHIGAPGVNIYSSVKGNAYDTWSGTSMATPHVSGVAALLAAHEPQLSGVEIKKRLLSTTRSLSSLRGKTTTGGLVNAYAALINAQTAPDLDDPVNWVSMAVDIQSSHPYKSKANDTFEIQAPGAKEFSIYFSKFDSEKNFDEATIFDKAGNVVGKLSGPNNETFSPVITGDYAKIVFKSDDSVEGYGFEITKLHYR